MGEGERLGAGAPGRQVSQDRVDGAPILDGEGPPERAPAHDDPLALIERLGELHGRGILSDEEFAAKKQELLARL